MSRILTGIVLLPLSGLLVQAEDNAQQKASLAEFADIKNTAPGAKDTLDEVAKRELFEIRNLAIGKPVPDIQGKPLGQAIQAERLPG
jgi:hypothetical protein